VHTPLLTLLLIARAQRGGDGRVAFADIDERLAGLLREFGPPRKSVHPEYPFWHLQSDGFWEVDDAARYPLKKGGRSVARTELLRRDARGHVKPRLWEALTRDALLRRDLVARLLDDYWPETLHDPLRAALGLADEDSAGQRRRTRRDPDFREAVLRAYERRCAVCGYDGRLGDRTLALDAAHIRWHCYDGPDEIENGLALCSFHHRALDSGALGVTPDLRVAVSADVHGGPLVDSWLLEYAGRPVRKPQRGMPGPADPHVRWHAREVFRKPPRQAG
jgi:putative restriction endonuclease